MELKKVKSMLTERVIEWTREWEQEGFRKGYEQGFKEGYEEGLRMGHEQILEEARSVLVEAIEQRFGQVPDTARQRITAMNSIREIMEAHARAVTAPSLDALGIA
jgi:flagellar biosynthesis/type III secretory pathway protein FliH